MKVCPVCGSENISYALDFTTAAIYKCKRCNYTGPLILEDDDGSIAKKLREDYEKKKR